jgi:hypothetical protein
MAPADLSASDHNQKNHERKQIGTNISYFSPILTFYFSHRSNMITTTTPISAAPAAIPEKKASQIIAGGT